MEIGTDAMELCRLRVLYEEGRRDMQDFYSFKAFQNVKISNHSRCRSKMKSRKSREILPTDQGLFKKTNVFRNPKKVKGNPGVFPVTYKELKMTSRDVKILEQSLHHIEAKVKLAAKTRTRCQNTQDKNTKIKPDRIINVLVQCPDGKTQCLIKKSSTTLQNVKQELVYRTGVPLHHQYLQYQGKCLNGREYLGELQSSDKTDVLLVMLDGCLLGGMNQSGETKSLEDTHGSKNFEEMFKELSLEKMKELLERKQLEKEAASAVPRKTLETEQQETEDSKKRKKKKKKSKSKGKNMQTPLPYKEMEGAVSTDAKAMDEEKPSSLSQAFENILVSQLEQKTADSTKEFTLHRSSSKDGAQNHDSLASSYGPGLKYKQTVKLPQPRTLPLEPEDIPTIKKDASKFCEFITDLVPSMSFTLSQSVDRYSQKLQVRQIFVKKGSKANWIENNLSFLVIYRDYLEETDPIFEKLWGVVQEYQEKWIAQLDDESQRVLTEKPCNLRGNGNVKVKHLDITFKRHLLNPKVIIIQDSDVTTGKIYFDFDEAGMVQIYSNQMPDFAYHIKIPFKDLAAEHVKEGAFMKCPDTKQCASSLPERTAAFGKASLGKCTPRKFDHEGDKIFYTAGFELQALESGPSTRLVKRPCHEFKYLASKGYDEDVMVRKFISETLRFACGCLNRRSNGTIHFGVADEKPEHAQEVNKRPREVVGVPIRNIVKYKDALADHKQRCFGHPQFATRCIRDPEFVEVRTLENYESSDENVTRYVIEVDIDPQSDFTKKKLFSVKMPKLHAKGLGEVTYYERCESETREMNKERISMFHQNEIKVFDEARKKDELLFAKELRAGAADSTGKVKRLLGTKFEKLDLSFERILVISKFDNNQRIDDDLVDKFAYLSNIEFRAIIDFNSSEQMHKYQQKITENTKFDGHHAEDYESEGVLGTALDRPQFVLADIPIKGNECLDWMTWRNSGKKRGLDKIIQKLSSGSPEGRLIVMFLIFPGVTKKEELTFGHFCTHSSENQVMFYLEDDSVAQNWIDSISGNYMGEHKASERGIRGLPWEKFRQIVQQLAVGFRSGEIYLPISPYMSCPISKRDVDDKVMSIVSAKECEDLVIAREERPEEYNALDQDAQKRFYQGQAVSWENFSFGHVVKRDAVGKLEQCINDAREYLYEEEVIHERVVLIRLFASRGAGGSTTARHLLWKLARTTPFRFCCCVVKSIEDKTVQDILIFTRKYTIPDMPYIILVDEFTDTLVTSLSERLEKGLSLENEERKFMIVHVKRSENPKLAAKNCKYGVSLDYDLSQHERSQFKERYVQLKHSYDTQYPSEDFEMYADNNLVSFMILLKPQEEKRIYTKKLVASTMEHLCDSEKEMISFLSLLHLHDPYPVFLSCFDSLMIEYDVKKLKYTCNWTASLTTNASKCLREYDVTEHYGSGRAIAITHPFLSEDIIQWKYNKESKTVADIALDFLQSSLFSVSETVRQHGHVKHLFDTVNIVLKKRSTYGKDSQKSQFSTLIEKILNTDRTLTKAHIETAAEVLCKGFEVFNDPVLAQQTARLFIFGQSLKNHRVEFTEKAREHANKALNMHRKNSFFMNTLGQVYKRNLEYDFYEIRKYFRMVDADKCLAAIQLAEQALYWFRRSQEVDQEGSGGLNNSCYYAELEVMFYLLDVLSNLKAFKKCGILQNYLCEVNFVCGDIEDWPEKTHKFLKEFKDRYHFCIERIEETMSVLKRGKNKDVEDEFKDKDIEKFTGKYLEYFTQSEMQTPTSPESRWRYNWDIINRCLWCLSFGGPFHIHKSKGLDVSDVANRKELAYLKTLVEENLECTPNKIKDVFIKIILSMAMHSPYGFKLPRPQAIEEYFQVKTFVDKFHACPFDEHGNYRVYSYLLKMMFNWPHDEKEMHPKGYHLDNYHQANEELRQYVEQMRERSKPADDPEVTLYKKMHSHRPKLKVKTLFLLGKGSGLEVFVHINEFICGSHIDWENPESSIFKRLRRLRGNRTSIGHIEVEPIPGQGTFRIEMAFRGPQGFSRGPVSFFVAFTWKGAMAYTVRPISDEPTWRYAPRQGITKSDDALPKPLTYSQTRDKVHELKERIQKASSKERQQLQDQIRKLEMSLDEGDFIDD